MNKNKELGMLLGLHCGDSLGATLEFGPSRSRENFLEDIIGGGEYHWTPGAPTDDTDLAFCLLQSLTQNKTFVPEDYTKYLIAWYHSNPPDIGNTTKAALKRLIQGISFTESGGKDETTQTNGSLMRCAPLALLPFNEDMIKIQCAMTHAHQTCIDADLIFISALKDALLGKDKTHIYNSSLHYASRINLKIHEELLKIPNTPWEDLRTGGLVVETLAASFWGLLNSENFKDAIVLVVNRGNDSDTVGAVTGALCGAYYGLDSIPQKWLQTIQLKIKMEKLYADFM